jgi:hypothetical protein
MTYFVYRLLAISGFVYCKFCSAVHKRFCGDSVSLKHYVNERVSLDNRSLPLFLNECCYGSVDHRNKSEAGA